MGLRTDLAQQRLRAKGSERENPMAKKDQVGCRQPRRSFVLRMRAQELNP